MIQTRVQLLIFFFVQTPLLRHYSTCFTCNDLSSPLDYHSILIQSILSIKYMHFCFNPELHSHIFWPGTEKWFPFKQLTASRVVSSSSSRAPLVVGDVEDGRTLSLNRRWTTAEPSEYRSWWYVGRDPSTDLWQQKKNYNKNYINILLHKEIKSRLHWFCYTPLHDWSRKLSSPSSWPITSQTKTCSITLSRA